MRSNQKTSNRVFVDIESMGDMRDESKHGNESARSKATPKSQTTTSTLHNAHMNDATYESRIGILAHGASPICKYATAERKFQMENHGKQGIESENGVDVDTNAENTASTSVKARSKHASNANPLSEIQHAHVRKHADITWTKHSDDYIAPLISLTELLREDEKFVEYKRSNITFDTYSVIPLFGFLISVFITRGSVMDSFSLSAFFSAAFVLNILALVGFTVAIYILLSERFSNPNLNSAKKKKRVKSATTATDRPYSDDSDVDVDVDSIEAAGDEPRRSLAYNKFFMQIVETTVFQESFELLALTSTMAIGLYLYARVKIGQCSPHVSTWQSQSCNPVANAGSIPHDQVLLCYIAPIVWQLFLKRIRFRTIIGCWIISTVFVGSSIFSANAYLQIYSLIYSLPFLYMHYETERFMKASYLQNMVFVEEILRQQRKEKHHALDKLNYEYKLEKIIEKQQFSQEINHLRILIDKIAHNLRTPIQSINMGIELLRSEYSSVLDEMNEKGKSELPFEFLTKTISASCMFMTMAINRSVDFNKVNSNVSLIPTFQTKKFLDVLSEPIACIKTLQNTVPLKVGPVPVSMCSHIILDEIWIKESLLCLLSNSVKYSYGGVIRINTEIVLGISKRGSTDSLNKMSAAQEDENMYIKITVVDDGVGINEVMRKNIFQPLRPSKTASGGKESGTGLGLYSLMKRMEALKGSCGTNRRSDGLEGAEVWFCFPYRPDAIAESYDNNCNDPSITKDLSRCNSDDQSISNSISDDTNLNLTKALSVVGANSWAQRRLRVRKTNFSAPVNITTDGAEMTLSAGSSLKCEDTELSCGVPKVEPLRILIIEDSITVIMIVTKLLEKKGHIVESAKNGFSGLNRLKEVFNTRSDFDLVLLDVQMPVLDGFECVSRYRAFEVEQIKNLNNSVLSKSKTDTLKLLLHSNYFRVNYTNNLGSNSFNIDNFKYMKSDGSSKNSVGSQEPAHVCHSIKLANVPDDYYDARPDARIGSPEHNSMNIGRDFGPRLHGSSPKEGISRTSSSNGLNVVLRRGNMAIVGMSANNDNESRILALRKGMNFFITKPFSGVDLQNILNLFDS